MLTPLQAIQVLVEIKVLLSGHSNFMSRNKQSEGATRCAEVLARVGVGFVRGGTIGARGASDTSIGTEVSDIGVEPISKSTLCWGAVGMSNITKQISNPSTTTCHTR